MDENLLRAIGWLLVIPMMIILIALRQYTIDAKPSGHKQFLYLTPLLVTIVLAIMIVFSDIDTGMSDLSLFLSFALIGLGISEFSFFFIGVVPEIRSKRKYYGRVWH